MNEISNIPEFKRLQELNYDISMAKKHHQEAKKVWNATKKELATAINRRQKLLRDPESTFQDLSDIRSDITALEEKLAADEKELMIHEKTISESQDIARKIEPKFEKKLLPIVDEIFQEFVKNTKLMADANQKIHDALTITSNAYAVISDVCGKQLVNLWPGLNTNTTNRIQRFADFEKERWEKTKKQITAK